MMRMVRMQRRSHGFVLLFLVVFISGMVLSGPSAPRRSRVRRQNMKVRINATGDTIVMKFLLPNTDTKLEGYILGYGSSMFSKQFIQLPEDGKLYETEFDAEPKYLIAVQPVQTNEVKKKCTGKVDLEKPLHLVIGSVSPTSVVLSWGTLLKTSYQGNIMNDCLEDGHYTVRYREKNRKWNYQTCPTKDTVIDNLKPNTVYEFGVQPSSKDGTGVWSKPVIHNVSTTAIDEKTLKKIFKRPVNPPKPQTPGPHTIAFSPRHVHLNRTQGRQVPIRNASPKTTLAPSHTARQKSLSTPGPRLPVVAKQPIGSGILRSPIDEVPQSTVNSSSSPAERSPIKPRPKVQTHSGHNNVQPFSPSKTLTTSLSSSTPRADGEPHKAKTLPKAWSKENPGKDKTTMFLLVFLIH
ncbi:target of Nesh-SH3-like isoform X2 [Nelusetta ayraudi]|uniref:target of Nesh-SH3-like isoform X2 n=1 Tax=Nelusetta ayraudi TaxID=303726 RepID=UPI003F720ED0